MKSFTVAFARSAQKEFDRLPTATAAKVVSAARALESDPRPRSCKKLKGFDDTYRLRIGNYRVVYEVHDKEVVVLVIRIRHRKDAY